MNDMLEYNPERVLEYVNMVKKHVKTLAECNKIFKEYNIEFYITENVMPVVNKINVLPVKEVIREVFMNNIIKAKVEFKMRNYHQSLYLDVKLFLRSYILAAENQDFGYDKVRLSKIQDVVELLPKKQKLYALQTAFSSAKGANLSHRLGHTPC